MSEALKTHAVYAITRHGVTIGERIARGLAPASAQLFVSERVAEHAPPEAQSFAFPIQPVLGKLFHEYDAHIFIVSAGAVVRLIAPLLRNKKIDPAVVCVDDAARFSISMLSGHIGRGNELAGRVATILDAQAVITTASDARGTLPVDILGRELGWRYEASDRVVTRSSAAMVNESPILFVQETGEPDFWPQDRVLPAHITYATSLDEHDPAAFEAVLVVSHRDLRRANPELAKRAVIYRPKSLVLGVGCDRGTPLALIERGVDTILKERGLSSRCIRALATIDQKADEEALIALSREHDWPLRTYSAAELDARCDEPGVEDLSEVVRRHVGTRGVAEPAALLQAGAQRLLVPKRRYTEEGAGRSMTLAVTEIPFAHRLPHASLPGASTPVPTSSRALPTLEKR